MMEMIEENIEDVIYDGILKSNSIIVFNKIAENSVKDKYDDISCNANLLLESALQASFDFNHKCKVDDKYSYRLFDFVPSLNEESDQIVKVYSDSNMSELDENTKKRISEFIEKNNKYTVSFKDAFLFALIYMFYDGRKTKGDDKKAIRFNVRASCGERSYIQVVESVISFFEKTFKKDIENNELIQKLYEERELMRKKFSYEQTRLEKLAENSKKTQQVKNELLKDRDKLFLLYQIKKIDDAFNFIKAFYMSERVNLFLSEKIQTCLYESACFPKKDIDNFEQIFKVAILEDLDFITLCFESKHPDPFCVLLEIIVRYLKSKSIENEYIDRNIKKDMKHFEYLNAFGELNIKYFDFRGFIDICKKIALKTFETYEKQGMRMLNGLKKDKVLDVTKFSQETVEGIMIRSNCLNYYFDAFKELKKQIAKPDKIHHKYLFLYFNKARECVIQEYLRSNTEDFV